MEKRLVLKKRLNNNKKLKYFTLFLSKHLNFENNNKN